MTENIVLPQTSQPVARPLGVWILTINALLFEGIPALLLSLLLLISGNSNGGLLNILLSICIGIGLIISAVGTWKGNNTARKSLLFFVTLNHVLIAINNFILINSGLIPGDEQIRLWGRVLRGFLYPALYIWYFNKYTTKEFFD